MSLVRSGPSTQPPGDVSVTRYLARGAAADIWVVSSEQLSKRVYKTLRISPERLIRNHLDDSIGLQSSENLWTSFLEEFSAVVRTWLSLDHRNVVRIFGISDETSLEVDYYGGGCVRDYLKAHSSTVDKAAMFSDVLAGMKHLHRNDPPIVHGNVNAGKLFVDHTGKTVVGEFGLTALCYPFAAYAPSISFDGLTRWFSPELFDDDTDQIPQPTLASDIWALGCTLYEILAEKLPYFEYKHEIKVQRAILAGERPGRCDDKLKTSRVEFLWPIVEPCWTLAPEDRPNVSRLAEKLQHRSTEVEAESFVAGQRVLVLSKKNQKLTGEQVPDTIISYDLELSEVIKLLVSPSCPDVTRELMDLTSCTIVPQSGGKLYHIYRGELRNSPPVAIKILRSGLHEDSTTKRSVAEAARRAYTWSRCHHTNLLPLIGLAEFLGQIAMVYPWMNNGHVRNYVNQQPGADRFNLCTQIACGLAYLHSIGTVHGNLTGDNVLVSNEGVPMLGGFSRGNPGGSAIQFPTLEHETSPRWAAPEILEGEYAMSMEADVYALGMVVLEVFTGNPPYSNLQHFRAVVVWVLSGRMPQRPLNQIPPNDSQGDMLWTLMTNCWQHEPSIRPTAAYAYDTLKACEALTIGEELVS